MRPAQRSVAPVVGIILLVAIVVLLAVTVGFIAITLLGGINDPAPTAAFDVKQTADGTVVITHNGGDAIASEQLELNHGTFEQLLDTITAGDTITVTELDSDELTLVWNAGDRSTILLREPVVPTAIGEDSDIQNWFQLDAIREHEQSAQSGFTLIAGLDANTPGYEQIVATDDGFEPIKDFSGTFDGKDNAISDLFIDRSDESDVGLFATTADDTNTSIQDVTLEDVEVTGSEDVGVLIGDIPGENDDGPTVEIRDVTVDNADVTGDEEVGGLVGDIGDIDEDVDATIDRVLVGGSSVEASDEDGEGRVGGLVGNNRDATIEESAVVGTNIVSKAPDDEAPDAGGLVGRNIDEGEITTSYAIATVEGEDNVGGLVGQDTADGDSDGNTVRNSFSASTIIPSDSEDEEFGGLAGRISGPNGESLFWDGEVADDEFDEELEDAGFGSYDNSTRLSTDEMQGDDADSNMNQLDFDETWDTAGDDYPVLQALDEDRQLNAR